METEYMTLAYPATCSANLSVWERIETMKPYIHEAGHAVVARRRLENMLNQNWHLITHVAEELLRRRTITGAELDEIIGNAEHKEAA